MSSSRGCLLTVNREIEAADDAKREAEARKVVEGEKRMKRKGQDFYSDDDSDDDGKPRTKRLDRRTRRKMKDLNAQGISLVGTC